MAGGGGDQAASAVGNGIVEPGIVSCTLGTSGVVFAHMEQVAYDAAGRVQRHSRQVVGFGVDHAVVEKPAAAIGPDQQPAILPDASHENRDRLDRRR